MGVMEFMSIMKVELIETIYKLIFAKVVIRLFILNSGIVLVSLMKRLLSEISKYNLYIRMVYYD